MEIKLHKWLQDIKLIVQIQGETSIHTWFEFMPILLVYVLESKTCAIIWWTKKRMKTDRKGVPQYTFTLIYCKIYILVVEHRLKGE